MAESNKIRELTAKNVGNLHHITKNSLLVKLKEFSLECFEDVRTYNNELAKLNIAEFEPLKKAIDKLASDQNVSFKNLEAKLIAINEFVGDKLTKKDTEFETEVKSDEDSLQQELDELKKKNKELLEGNQKLETKLSKAEQKQANAEQEISNLKSDNKRLM